MGAAIYVAIQFFRLAHRDWASDSLSKLRSSCNLLERAGSIGPLTGRTPFLSMYVHVCAEQMSPHCPERGSLQNRLMAPKAVTEHFAYNLTTAGRILYPQ